MINLTSLLNGRAYRLNATEILAWYEEHVREAWASTLRQAGDAIAVAGTAFGVLIRGGEAVDAFAAHNIVTNAGRAHIIDRLQAASAAVCDYMAIGTSTTAADAADTTLGTETGTRVQGTLSQPTAYTDRLVSTFAAGNGTATIGEVGRLNASTSGTLMGRLVLSPTKVKGADDSLQVTYDFTYAAS